MLPTSLSQSMAAFFNQARANLGPLSDARLEREWLSKVRVVSTSQPLLPPKVNVGVFEEVSNALYGNRWLEVDYRNAQGKRSKASVMPLGMAQQGPALYLICRHKDFSNERCLALHRIVSTRASTLTFERPKEFNLQKYDDEGRFGFGNGKKIHLSFRIDKAAGRHLLEAQLSLDQTVKEKPNHYDIAATVVETEQLEWWLRGFGDRVSNIRRTRIPTASTND